MGFFTLTTVQVELIKATLKMIKKMGLEERSGQQGTATSENSEMT
jgi:hypothetical protein